MNPTRMHVVTHLSPKYAAMMNSENGWSIEEAGMAQLDDDIGLVMQHLKDAGLDDNTIVVFTTDNGTETFTWPDGGSTPFAQGKGTVMEGGFRVPCIVRWPGHVAPNSVQNGIMSGLDWLPTFASIAGNPNISDQLLKGVKLGDRTYKNHLDGYDQTAMLTDKGPSTRHEIFYLGESTIGAVRIDDYKYRFIDQPQGWLGVKTHPDVPMITNLRLDPYEKLGFPEDLTRNGSLLFFSDWYMYQFWRFVFVQRVMGQGNPDLPGIPADATWRKLQPRRPESRNGRQDGPGGGGCQRPQQLTETYITEGVSREAPFDNSVNAITIPLSKKRKTQMTRFGKTVQAFFLVLALANIVPDALV